MLIGHPDRSQAQPPANPDWFPGTVWQYEVTTPQTEGGIAVLAVWFEAGSRTRPHVHPVDQALQVMEGVGIVATETEKRIIRAGDTVVVPAGVWHWHGALPDEPMMHLSIKLHGPTDWTSPWKDWDTYAEGAQELAARSSA
ncbi:MAG TPA: cupin domain-containing protein [Baekduia sp.]|nr:cupin domain-containing protein [Baekduia sp.]